MGRPPIGDKPLTRQQKDARYRASTAQQLRDAYAAIRDLHDRIVDAKKTHARTILRAYAATKQEK